MIHGGVLRRAKKRKRPAWLWGLVLLILMGHGACRQSIIHRRVQGPLKNQQIYILPIPAGQEISKWCACRSIGTSPHIGRDVALRGQVGFASVALADGVVKEKNFIKQCGWEVIFEDHYQVKWRYLHLEEPLLQVGQKLRQGERVGVHKSYPLAGCGVGAHLHLERRTAGQWSGNPRTRDCGKGLSNCYFNPDPNEFVTSVGEP